MAQKVPPVVVNDSEPRLAARRTREPLKNVDNDRSSGKGFIRETVLKFHIHHIHAKRDRFLRDEITRLRLEVMQRNSSLDKMKMKLTGKETYFTLSSSVQLSSCAELEAGVSANEFQKTKLRMFKKDSDKLLRMNVQSLLNPLDEEERKVIAAVASTELMKISQPPSITQGQVNFPHRVRFLQLMGHTSG
ncbi:hypothetical protein AJ78_02944 [Emergomyces pasteurianus Ep9510]|uniref:Uncharacterized protein n=1 Tax=Emergomyces pasteurianus Ep9510 TaxID=1447872 RepID=A0A1J9Q9I7_9EURO|nr:hypothetical protein AJ78_02944 [Emergomyces pasteurianus Ep9510]